MNTRKHVHQWTLPTDYIDEQAAFFRGFITFDSPEAGNYFLYHHCACGASQRIRIAWEPAEREPVLGV